MLVRIYKDKKVLKAYAVIDDQSNRSLARAELLDFFEEDNQDVEYILSSCAGQETRTGRRGKDYAIESLDGNHKMQLHTLIECTQIPNMRQEISTPEVAMYHRHLRDIERCMPDYDPEAHILLLI